MQRGPLHSLNVPKLKWLPPPATPIPGLHPSFAQTAQWAQPGASFLSSGKILAFEQQIPL
jgi:hypothetical protein